MAKAVALSHISVPQPDLLLGHAALENVTIKVQITIWMMKGVIDKASPCNSPVLEFIMRYGFSSIYCGFYQFLSVFTSVFLY